MYRTRIVGPGRAGTALRSALIAAGWPVEALVGRGDDVAAGASGVDLLVLAVPDREVAALARSVEVEPETVVIHLSGSLTLEALDPHPRRASVHPLVPLPDGASGARRLAGATFALAGDPLARSIVAALDGRPIEVADEDRVRYHAAAVIASNHLVGLLGQVERVAATAGVPLEAYLGLVRAAVDDVDALGPRAALTGPVARGDQGTIDAHLEALDPSEREGYEAGVALCRTLADRSGTPAR